MEDSDKIKGIQEEALKLFIKKNNDYGDSYKTYGPIGVIVRMGDKINRLSNISSKSIQMINTESLRDTLIDLHNYSAMAIMLLDENKKLDMIKKEKDTYNYEHTFFT